MKETNRLYEFWRGNSDSIGRFGPVTILVNSIDEQDERVAVTINPNLAEYRISAVAEGVGLESAFAPHVLTASRPAEVLVEGKRYRIRLVSVGATIDRRKKMDILRY